MKKFFIGLSLAALSTSAHADFFGSNNGEWKMGPYGPYWEESSWPTWTPMYWMEEMMDSFDDDNGYNGFGSNNFGNMPFFGNNTTMPFYGGNNFMPMMPYAAPTMPYYPHYPYPVYPNTGMASPMPYQAAPMMPTQPMTNVAPIAPSAPAVTTAPGPAANKQEPSKP